MIIGLKIGLYFAKYSYCETFNKKVWIVGEYSDDPELVAMLGLHTRIVSTESRSKAFLTVVKLAAKSFYIKKVRYLII